MTIIKSNKDVLISIVLLISILLTTVVYSAFSTKLQIGGELVVRSDDDIRVSNISIKEQTGGAYETYNNKYTKNTTSMFITLPSNSSITYEIDVSNKSDSIYTLSKLNELTTINSNLSYEIDTELYDIYESNIIRKITIIISNNSNEEIKDNIILEYKFEIAKCTFINLAGNVNATYETEDVNIQNIARTSTLSTNLTKDNIISTSDSTVPIYAWYDNGTIYYYTKYVEPKMNVQSEYMFNRLTKVTDIDLNTLDTSQVINMSYMFYKCSAISLDLNNFDTTNVINMSRMFFNSQTTTINGLNKFNTSKVTNMVRMFASASATTLDLSSFDTNNVTDMTQMFYSSNATVINGLENFKTSKVLNMNSMFRSAKAINLNLSSFDTSNVTDMSQMFYGSNATVIDGLENFKTSNVVDMSSMFNNSKVINLDLSNFDTSNVTKMNSMFSHTQATTIKGLDNFNTTSVTDMSYMFSWCVIETIDVSSFNTNNVTNMEGMFNSNNNALTTIYASDKFVTDAVTNSSNMFFNCVKLVGGNGTKYNSTYIDKTYATIDTSETPGYFTQKNS